MNFKENGFYGEGVMSYDEYYKKTGIKVDTFLVSNPIKPYHIINNTLEKRYLHKLFDRNI